MGHSTAGSLEMKMNKRINNDESSPAITTREKSRAKLVRIVLISLHTLTAMKKGKSVVFGNTSGAVRGCNLNFNVLAF